MRIKTFRFSVEGTNSYVIEDSSRAIFVDVPSIELIDIINNHGLSLDYVFLTHEHCDHLWGLNAIRREFNTKVVTTKQASIAIGDSRENRACVHHIYIAMKYGAETAKYCTPDPRMICERADIEYDEPMKIEWLGHNLRFVSTPGHSKGSGMLILDNQYLFSGDTLIKDQPIFTRFETGDMETYQKITLPLIKSFPPDILVFPGHGDGFDLRTYKLV